MVAGWSRLSAASGVSNQGKARAALLADNLVKLQTPEQLVMLREGQANFYRRYASAKQRPQCVELYGALAKQFPKDVQRGINYLAAATDYAPPEVQKDAAEHLLGIPSESNQPDVWRRMMIAAEKNMDPALAKRVLAYAAKSQQQFGRRANLRFANRRHAGPLGNGERRGCLVAARTRDGSQPQRVLPMRFPAAQSHRQGGSPRQNQVHLRNC